MLHGFLVKLHLELNQEQTQQQMRTNQDDSTYTAKAEISNHVSIYVEPTVFFGNFGLYAKGGAARVTLDSLESISSGTDSSTYGDDNISGILGGVGLRASFGRLLIKTEWVKTKYSKVRFTSTTGNKNIVEATPEQESVKLAIGFQF